MVPEARSVRRSPARDPSVVVALVQVAREASEPVNYDRNFPRAVAIVFGGLGALRAARYAVNQLPQVEGWETDAIARAIAAGEGFRFPGWRIRWHWDMPSQDPNAFFPTAWEDPVYTYLLAGIHLLFDESAFVAAYALNFICIAIIAYLVYRVASRFAGAWTGRDGRRAPERAHRLVRIFLHHRRDGVRDCRRYGLRACGGALFRRSDLAKDCSC